MGTGCLVEAEERPNDWIEGPISIANSNNLAPPSTPVSPVTNRLGEDSSDPRHIIDILLEERCVKMQANPLWPLYKRILYPILRYREAVRMADEMPGKNGMGVLDHVSELLTLNVTTENLDIVPKSGRIIIASTHPTGIADGVAIFDALKAHRPDMMIFANRDAIRAAPQLDEIIIPVEWVQEKRTRQRSRETLIETKKAFEYEKCLVLFPSGRLAYMKDRVLTEQEWMNSVVNLARKYQCDVVPVHMQARNSWLYYWFRNLGTELRDITLFNELLNKKNKPFHLTFGSKISHNDLKGDPDIVTTALRNHAVEHVVSDTPWSNPTV